MVSDTDFILKSKTRKHLEKLTKKKKRAMLISHFIGFLLLYFIQLGQQKTQKTTKSMFIFLS